jgi:hypothetical protein
MNPYVMEVMLQERKKEVLAEAQRQQLLAAYEADRKSIKSRLLNSLGNLLIAAGEKLTHRHGHGQELSTG